MKTKSRISELPRLRNRVVVFRDRSHAGEVLADMLRTYREKNAVVLAIPDGGLPVATTVAKQLGLPLDVAVTSKITLPWNSEVVYGVVAFDGTVSLNEEMISNLHLTEQEVRQGTKMALQKAQGRLDELRGPRPLPDLSGLVAILVDDGIASGFTIRTAVAALRKAQVEQIAVAVPTAHEESLQRLASQVDSIYCPNIHSGWRFAVADAYQYQSDIVEKEIKETLNGFV